MTDKQGARAGSTPLLPLALAPGNSRRDTAAKHLRANSVEASVPVKQTQIVSIQILRFVAAFSVTIFHLVETSYRSWGFQTNPLTRASYGVDIFFVISGFVIALSAQRHRSPGDFFFRRAARIIPLYWLLTIIVAAIAIAAPHLLKSTTFSVENLLTSLFFIPHARPNGAVEPMLFVGWSLNYEMFFYAIFALSLYVKSWSPIYPCALVAILVAAGKVLPSDNVIWTFYTNPIVLEFVFGAVVYQVWRARGQAGTVVPTGFLISILLASFALFFADAFIPRVLGPGLAAVLLLIAAVHYRVPRHPITNLLAELGGASYSLYLVHPYVIAICSALVLNRTQSLPLHIFGGSAALVVSVMASLFLYRWIEKPSQAFLLRRFAV